MGLFTYEFKSKQKQSLEEKTKELRKGREDYEKVEKIREDYNKEKKKAFERSKTGKAAKFLKGAVKNIQKSNAKRYANTKKDSTTYTSPFFK